MGLSSEQYQHLRQLESTYEYDSDELADKSVTLVPAPSKTGKSTIIARAVELGRERGHAIAEVNSIMTRPRRPGIDPVDYRTADEGITHQWMYDQIIAGKLPNWSLFPNGDIYGTDVQSFPAEFNLLPMQVAAIERFKRIKLRNLNIMSIVTDADEWQSRFDSPITSQSDMGRLIEAKESLDYGMTSHDGICRIVDHPGEKGLAAAAEALLTFALTDHADYRSDLIDRALTVDYEKHNRAMYNAAQQMIDTAEVA
jgi:hypothetical protein